MKYQDRIVEHRKKIPRQFRKVYDCMGYVFKEVKLCCSPQCPLFPYRPLRGVSYGVSGVGQSGAESTKTGNGGNYAE